MSAPAIPAGEVVQAAVDEYMAYASWVPGLAAPARLGFEAGFEAAYGTIPPGYALVPIEPTEAMKIAGLQELPWGQNFPVTAQRCWSAMRAASPSPRDGGEG